MSKASFNPAEMSAAEAVDLLVKTAEVSFAAGELVKEAKLPGFLNELVNPTGTLGHTARNALIGSGIGGLVGAVREFGRPEEERNYGGGIGRGALLGGLAGGAGTLLAEHLPKANALTTEEQIQKELGEHSQAVRARALSQTGGGKVPTQPADSPHRSAVGNALNSDYAPPALRVMLNPDSGPVDTPLETLGLLAAPLDSGVRQSLADTPVASAAGALYGQAVGSRLGGGFGNFLTGQRRGVGGRPNPFAIRQNPFNAYRGIAGNANGTVVGNGVRASSRLIGGAMGGFGGAVVGQGIQHLIQKLRGG